VDWERKVFWAQAAESGGGTMSRRRRQLMRAGGGGLGRKRRQSLIKGRNWMEEPGATVRRRWREGGWKEVGGE
jgi:hypothetical protein